MARRSVIRAVLLLLSSLAVPNAQRKLTFINYSCCKLLTSATILGHKNATGTSTAASSTSTYDLDDIVDHCYSLYSDFLSASATKTIVSTIMSTETLSYTDLGFPTSTDLYSCTFTATETQAPNYTPPPNAYVFHPLHTSPFRSTDRF
jgi:hypothetical protein